MTDPELREIRLHGMLAERYGEVHRLAVKTPAEVIRAFCANYQDFERVLIESAESNIGWKIIVGDEALEQLEHMHYPAGQAVIHIAPVIGGAKSGIGQVFLGVALIGASFIPGLNVAVMAGSAGFLGTATYASIAFGLGVSLALGGISQMLSPQPKASAPSERPENKPSYSFDGAVNTTAQGQAVPFGFGEMIIGSAVISAGISADNFV